MTITKDFGEFDEDNTPDYDELDLDYDWSDDNEFVDDGYDPYPEFGDY